MQSLHSGSRVLVSAHNRNVPKGLSCRYKLLQSYSPVIAAANRGGSSASSAKPSPPSPCLASSLATPLLRAFGPACLGRNINPSVILAYLQACRQAGHVPPEKWLGELYISWKGLISSTDLRYTVGLIAELTEIKITPPADWTEAIYYQVSHNQQTLEGKDVITFLEASQRIPLPRPDRDLILGLSQHLMSKTGNGEETGLSAMGAEDVCRLLLALAANQQPPGMLLAAASLQILAPAAAAGQLPLEMLVAALEAVALSAGPLHQLPMCPDVDALSTIAATGSAGLTRTAETDPQLAVRFLSALAKCRMPASSLPAICAVLQPSLSSLPPTSLSSLIVSLKRSSYIPTQEWANDFHAAVGQQLGSFSETDEMVELLKALEDMDLIMGFSFLNRLADSVAMNTRSLSEAGQAPGLEVPVCLYMLANLNHRPGYERIQAMISGLQPHLSSLPSLHLTNVLWALARLGHPVEGPFLLDARAAVERQQDIMLADVHSTANSVSSNISSYERNASSGSTATTTSTTTTSSSSSSSNSSSRSNSSNSSISSNSSNHDTMPSPESASWRANDADHAPDNTSISLERGGGVSKAVAGSGGLKPYQLAFVFGALQSLRCPMEQAFVDKMLECIAISLPAMLPHDVALVMGTVARLKHLTSYAWMAQVEQHLSLRIEAYTPKELVTVVWAMAKLHHRPPSEWTAAFQDGCFEVMGSFEPGNLATLVWSFAELEQPPTTLWMDNFCEVCRTRLNSMAPQDLASLLPSLARIGYQPDATWLSEYLNVVHAYLPALNGEGFAAVAKGLQDLGVVLSGDDFWDAFCLAMRARLPTMSPTALVETASGLLAAGYKPKQAWASSFLQACEQSHDAFSADELTQLVCALAGLKTAPRVGLLRDFLSRTPAVLPTLEPERITASASALAVIWSLPVSEASACTTDVMSPWLESLVVAAKGNLHSFGLIQLNDLAKAMVELQELYTQAPGGTSSNSPLSDFLAYLHEFFVQ